MITGWAPRLQLIQVRPLGLPSRTVLGREEHRGVHEGDLDVAGEDRWEVLVETRDVLGLEIDPHLFEEALRDRDPVGCLEVDVWSLEVEVDRIGQVGLGDRHPRGSRPCRGGRPRCSRGVRPASGGGRAGIVRASAEKKPARSKAGYLEEPPPR
jgi:hypothetical protein